MITEEVLAKLPEHLRTHEGALQAYGRMLVFILSTGSQLEDGDISGSDAACDLDVSAEFAELGMDADLLVQALKGELDEEDEPKFPWE